MRRHCRRSLLPHAPTQRRYRIPPVTSLAVLTGRALTLVGRHALLYVVVALAAIVGQWFIYRYVPTTAAILASNIIIGGIVDAIVLTRARGDIDAWSAIDVWDRILERLWVVVVVNFIFMYVSIYGIELVAQGDIVARIAAIPILLIAISLIFAEAVAVVVDEELWWFLPVRALGTSIRTTWSGATLGRAITLFMLQYVPVIITTLIAAAVTQGHPPASSFWTDVPLGIVFSIPLDVLIVLAFFDASGYEPKRTCDE